MDGEKSHKPGVKGLRIKGLEYMKANQFVASVCVCMALAFGVHGAASAALMTFADRATWRAEIGGSTTLETFNSIVADTPLPFDVGPFTISAVGTFAGDNGIEAFDPDPNDFQQDRNIDGTTYFQGDVDETVVTFVFDAAITAIGWDQVSIDFSPVNLNIGTESVAVGGTAFFGVISDTAFSQFTLDGSDGAFGLDNIEFGAPVPAPATFALISLGLVGLGFSRRTVG